MDNLSLHAIKEELLGILVEEEAGLRATDDVALVPVDRQNAMPLSFAQQRLWFLDRLDKRASAAYHIPAGVRLRGELEPAIAPRAGPDRRAA